MVVSSPQAPVEGLGFFLQLCKTVGSGCRGRKYRQHGPALLDYLAGVRNVGIFRLVEICPRLQGGLPRPELRKRQRFAREQDRFAVYFWLPFPFRPSNIPGKSSENGMCI